MVEQPYLLRYLCSSYNQAILEMRMRVACTEVMLFQSRLADLKSDPGKRRHPARV